MMHTAYVFRGEAEAMGILDWFKNRPSHFESYGLSMVMLRQAVELAVSITNPRLKLLNTYQEQLMPAVAESISFIREYVLALPPAALVSASRWSSDSTLKAFFAAPTDIGATIGRSSNLRTLFDKYPTLDEAYFVLVMAMTEQRSYGVSMQNNLLQRDSAQTILGFSDHQARICGCEEGEVRRLLGTQAFEYLVSQALSAISEERDERRELEDRRSLIRARLRLLRQQGPGFGSLFGSAPSSSVEQLELEAELSENELALEALGSRGDNLEDDLEILRAVLIQPDRYLQLFERHLRLNTLNVVVDDESTDVAANIDVFEGRLNGEPKLDRVFLLGRYRRAEMSPIRINFDEAVRYL